MPPPTTRRASAPAASTGISARKSLKAHQRNITSFLAQHCPTQTGVVLYHYMGTGKSFSSLTVAINWGADIVLLAPEMLLAQWKNDYFDTFATTRPNVAAMHSYETVWTLLREHNPETPEGKAWYARHTLIMDECHNIAFWMNHRVKAEEKGYFMRCLMAFGHRVLLTGTPMYWGARDLAFQVNIAAGKAVMPVDAVEFERKFFLTDHFKSALLGWLRPVHDFLQWTIGYVQGFIMRTDGLVMQLGTIATYLAIAKDGTSPAKRTVNNILAFMRPLQKMQVQVQRKSESAYIASTNTPLTFMTSRILRGLGIDKEYTKLANNLATSQGITVDTKLNMDAYDAFRKNQPVNASDYFVVINQMIEDMKTMNSTDSSSPSFAKLLPSKPPAGAPDTVWMNYHKESIQALLQGVDAKSHKEINEAREALEREVKKNFRSHATLAALQRLREVFYRAGGNRGKEHVEFYIKNFVDGVRRLLQVLIWQIQYLVVVAFINILIALSKIVYVNQNSLRYLNTAHFEKAVSPHISYYKPKLGGASEESREQSWLRWLSRSLKQPWAKRTSATRPSRSRGRSHRGRSAKSQRRTAEARTFPIVVPEVVQCPYTQQQTNLFIRFTMTKMDYNDYAALQLIRSPTDMPELEAVDQESQESFEVYGTYIGNICSFAHTSNHRGPTLHPHHRDHLTFNTAANVWTLRRGSELSGVSSKFEEMARRVRLHGGRQCLYSNYEMSSRTLCAYLVKEFGADCVRYVTNTATSEVQKQILEEWYYPGKRPGRESPKLLLLDTRYTEGLSVLKTDVMHILDPCQSLAKEEQLKARVARLNSHVKGDRLHMYEYMCYSPLFTRATSSLFNWFRLSPEYNFFSLPTKFSQNVTPEYVVKARLQQMDKLSSDLAKKLQSTSVERYMPDEATATRDGARTKWTKKMPPRCGTPIDCVVATPGNEAEWGDPQSCHRVHHGFFSEG